MARQSVPHPGVLLRRTIFPALGLSISQAARELQITRQTLHRILAGDAVTADMALRLERLCGVRSQFWLGLQQQCELDRISEQSSQVLDRIPAHRLPDDVLKEIGAIDG